MNNIVPFPTKLVRDRADVERAIRDSLSSVGASQDTVETVLIRMNDFIELSQFEFAITLPDSTPSSVYDSFLALSTAIQERTSKLIFERVIAELHNLGQR
jgi:hypothetical protein